MMESLVNSTTTALFENFSLHEFNESNIGNVSLVESLPHWKIVLDKVATGIMTFNSISIMLGMGAATHWRDVTRNFWPPIGVSIGMLLQFFLMPFMGFCLSLLFKLKPYEAMGVLIVSSSPGGTISNFFTFWMDGDLGLSIIMTTCSSIAAFGGMPVNLWIYTRYWVGEDGSHMEMPYKNILISLVFVMGPVLVGMVVLHFSERIAKIITKVTSVIGFIGIGSVIILWLFLYIGVFARATVAIIFVAILLPVLGFSIAYTFAKLLCRTHQVSRTIGIETGSQNVAVAISIILLSFSDPMIKGEMIIFPTLYALLMMGEMFITIGLFTLWKRKRALKVDDEHTIEQGSQDEKLKLNQNEKLKLNNQDDKLKLNEI